MHAISSSGRKFHKVSHLIQSVRFHIVDLALLYCTGDSHAKYRV